MKSTFVQCALLGALVACLGFAGTAAHARGNTVLVTTDAELEDAMIPANENKVILVQRKDPPDPYLVSGPLRVPKGATLQGEGAVMLFDEDDLPTGFQAGTDIVIKPASDFEGAGGLVVPGNRSAVGGLDLDASEAFAVTAIAVYSEGPGTKKKVLIEEVIARGSGNPFGEGIGTSTAPDGIFVFPFVQYHDEATVESTIRKSIATAPGYFGILYWNTGRNTRVTGHLTGNVAEAGIGLSVRGGFFDGENNVTVVHSQRNHWKGLFALDVSGAEDFFGPSHPSYRSVVKDNQAYVTSVDDRMTVPQTLNRSAVFVRGSGSGFGPGGGTDGNVADVKLLGSTLNAPGAGNELDIVVCGTSSPFLSNQSNNKARLLARNVQGNAITNFAANDCFVPGLNNTVEITGNLTAWDASNFDLDAQFFLAPFFIAPGN